MGFEVTTAGVLRVYLQVHQGIAAGQKFMVLEYPATIGRGDLCQVRLEDRTEGPTLSRQHARLHLEAGRITLEDLSRNGTWVEERLLERGETVVLRGGEPIWLGTETLITVDFVANSTLVAQSHPSRQAATQRQIVARDNTSGPLELHRLAVHALGRGSVAVDDRPIGDHLWASRKALVLLVFVAESEPDSVATERLMDVLWPDGRGGRSALQTTVSRVRQALRAVDETLPDPLRCERHRYSVGAAYQTTCDSRLFEAGCKAARAHWNQGQVAEAEVRLEASLGLYQGEFMEEANEDWVVQRRVRLAELYAEATMALALVRERSEDLRGAQDLYARLLERFPGRETAQCGIIRCLALQGYRDEALRQYELSVRQLRRTLDIPPGPSLLELREALSRGLPPPPPSPPFA